MLFIAKQGCAGMGFLSVWNAFCGRLGCAWAGLVPGLSRGSGSLLVALLCVGGLLGVGCKSPEKSKTRPLASVLIQGNTPGQISVVVADVFRQDGYKVVHNDFHQVRLEKKGSTMDNVAYGNWMGEDVWLRVDVILVQIEEGKFQVECEAWHIRDRGRALEETIKVSSLSRRPFQKLLDDVAARFAR